MIGAGGLAAFANDKSFFSWNDDGTKMVYTPKLIEMTGSGEHNGFVFDKHKRSGWLLGGLGIAYGHVM